jgi:DNA helicase-2/ATP-dependent DNA helicase PcrA
LLISSSPITEIFHQLWSTFFEGKVKKTPGQSVLFLSFSRAAVARVGEATRQEVPKAQRGMLSMQTFHSFFWTLLSAHAYHRSGGTEIATFGQDILLGKVRGSPYVGVSSFSYDPKRAQSAILRMAIGMLQRAIRKATGKYGKSVAILTHSGASAAKISAALNAEPKPVRHKLSFDEAEAMLTARFAAYLLEPKVEANRLPDLATALELLATAKRAAGLVAATQWQVWALKVRGGKVPTAKFVQSVLGVMDELRGQGFSGDPARDWNRIKRALRDVGDGDMTEVAKNLDYLVAFNRGKRISGGLGAVWARDGQYTDAREVLDTALSQDQILGGVDDPPGVQVMTVHKSKGKQFDGVIVVREGRFEGKQMVSSLVWWGDQAPHHRSRKILRVAITRAKVHTLMLGPIYPACPIVGPHKL